MWACGLRGCGRRFAGVVIHLLLPALCNLCCCLEGEKRGYCEGGKWNLRHRQDRFLIFVAFVSQPNPLFLALVPCNVAVLLLTRGVSGERPFHVVTVQLLWKCEKTTATRTGIMHFHLRDVTSIIASYRCQSVITTLNFRDNLI